MTTARSLKKKLAALTILPLAAALTLSACGDSLNDASNVNIQPVEETSAAPVDDTDETTVTPAPALDINDLDGEPVETSFTQSHNGITMTLTYTAIGDVVVKQTTSNVIDYAAAGLAGKEEAQALLDPMMSEGEDIEGYEQSIEYGDTSATEEVSIDYAVVDISELEGIPGFEGSGNMDYADYISFEESSKMLEQQGFTKVE